MGSDKNSNRRNCGNILINIKTIKNKSKIFTFHCAFCSTDCDQLKKFSKHLEEEHLHNFDEELVNTEEQGKSHNILLFEPGEIKVETKLDIESLHESDKKVENSALRVEECQDPLETESCQNDECNKGVYNKGYFKEELNQIVDEHIDKFNIESNILEDENDNDNTNDMSEHHKDFSSDEFSEDSNDIDFEIEHDLKNVKARKNNNNTKKEPKTEINKITTNQINDLNKTTDTNTSIKRHRRTIIEKILPVLIEQYKKYELLWQVKNIAFGVINKKYEVYDKIAEFFKTEHNRNLNLEDIKYHIKYLNKIYSKDKEQELKCKLEKREFIPKYELYKEMSFLSESQGPFLCAICNQILPKYVTFCQHMAKHNGTQPFKCPSCEMMLTNYHKYLIHKKRHLGIYNFHCNICGKGYLFKNDLEWHVTSHTGDKPYLCQICGTGFRARHGYDNHVRRHEERFRHECHICKRGFNQLHALNNHVKSHLNIRDVICKICGKGFVHSKYLRRHELIHGEVKNYKCNDCGKAFFQACGLRAHRKNHHT